MFYLSKNGAPKVSRLGITIMSKIKEDDKHEFPKAEISETYELP